MKRYYELGMTLNYAKDWSFVDAIREVFQNCIDEQIQRPEHKWYSEYVEDEKVLRVWNENTLLNTSSLLLGSTTKESDANTVGRHGEGYKVASVVLMRLGYPIRIYNYGKKELWEAKVVKSRRYGSEIVQFVVESIPGKDCKSGNLVFEISGVSKEDYASVVESNLWLMDGVEKYDGECGSVLLGEELSGKIFVNGLFVKKMKDCLYGYDFKPNMLKLDRDRRTLDSFDLCTSVCKLVVKLPTEYINEVKGAPECKYLHFYIQGAYEVYDDSFRKFEETYGKGTIPVNNSEDFNRFVKNGYKCQMLNDNEYSLVSRSTLFVQPDVEEMSVESDFERLNSWFNRITHKISEVEAEEGCSILEGLKEVLGL